MTKNKIPATTAEIIVTKDVLLDDILVGLASPLLGSSDGLKHVPTGEVHWPLTQTTDKSPDKE
jgi:hypothetical protein